MCFLVPINVVMSQKTARSNPSFLFFFFEGGQSKMIKFRNSKFKGLKLWYIKTKKTNIFINKNVMTHTRDLVQQRRYLGFHLKYNFIKI